MKCTKIIVSILLLCGVTMAHAHNDPLHTYHQKRNLTKTPEPAGKKHPESKKPIFVVQKHDASHLHYDFRLEIGGVLASWAVPKGPSMNPTDKRLAIRTEDHPLEYATFEGTIPEGNYGAGTVEIWDHGTFESLKKAEDPSQFLATSLKNGQLEIILHGKKLKGSFALVRLKNREKEQWLLIKMKEDPSDEDSKKKTKNALMRNGKEIAITNKDTILFPREKITKGDLIDYYDRIADHMVPLIKDRLITMHRFPNGIHEEGFYQKDAADYFPSWIKTKAVKKQEGGSVHYVVGTDAATLIYLANQACITPHIWLSSIDKLRSPDRMIFDLDPSQGASFLTIIATAKKLKTILEKMGLHPFVMTTGSRGLHVVVPLKPTATFDYVRACAQKIAQLLIADDPAHLTLEMRIEKRGKKVFIDTLRNSFGATGVAPYAVRARDGAPVATPLHWREVKRGLKPDQWNITNIFKRLARIEDPWKDIEKYRKDIKEACKRIKI